MMATSYSLSSSGLTAFEDMSAGMTEREGGEERVEARYFWEIRARGAKRRMVGTAAAVVLRRENQEVG